MIALRSMYKELGYSAFFMIAVLLDRVSKALVLHYVHDVISVMPGLHFIIAWNRGISFSLLHSDSVYGFYILTVFIMAVIAVFVTYTYKRYIQSKYIYWETLVLAGAVSNVIDRWIYGGVLDFIDFYVGSWHFATFNIADTLVFCGVIGMWFVSLRE